MKLLAWLNNLGEKSSRTDVWVVLITLMFLGCLFQFIQCENNWYVTTILIGMFSDLGINTIINKFKQ
jgi:hypothetical protein